MDTSLINRTETFVKRTFIQNPHYSFNDWSVMYNHSIIVKDLALEITSNMECDKEIVAIGALLHDIGKTYEASPETLHAKHELFNLSVSENFLESLNLSQDKLKKLKRLVSYSDDSTEMKVIKDADAIALYKDKKLYMLYIKWATKNKLDLAIRRKLIKFNNLNFNFSKKIAKPFFDQMKGDWEIYIGRSL